MIPKAGEFKREPALEFSKEMFSMKKGLRTQVVLAVVVSLGSAVGFADSGEAIYKANCQSCHGSTGTPNAGMAKMMSIKPASEYKTTEKEQIESVKNGKNKMKPFAGKLTDAQIKDAVTYFRTLK
jgi:mono/diheme cytochrome c family protein